MSFKIISAGPLTTVQDMGITGQLKNGFPMSGVMDRYNAALANILVSNSQSAAVLEMTMLGITAQFNDDCTIAITGADMQPQINEVSISQNKAIMVKSGDTLTMSAAKSGCRAYLAVSGGVDVPLVMGSRSTSLKCKTGGFEGRKLAVGDVIKTMQTTAPVTEIREAKYFPYDNDTFEVRAIPGPQDDYFTSDALRAFFACEYTVSQSSDRMGIRLDGEAITSISGTDIVSDGIAFGSIQVPSNGKPIVLMADRQTVGGYAKIATVITADLHFLAQASPGKKIKFKKVSRKEAIEALQIKENYLKNLTKGKI